MYPLPDIKLVPTWEYKVTDSKEVSCFVLQFKMKKNSFTFLKAGRTSYHQNIPTNVRIMRVRIRVTVI